MTGICPGCSTKGKTIVTCVAVVFFIRAARCQIIKT